MSTKEWLIVIGTGAAGPAAILAAAPLTVATGIAAALAFLVGAGGAAKALSMDPPKRNPNGSIVDREDPK